MEFCFNLLKDISLQDRQEAISRLSAKQREYILNKPQNKAEQSIAVRVMLASLLKQYLNTDCGYDISFDDNRKPYLIAHPEIYISLSHSCDAVACAFSFSPVGIDVEKIRPIRQPVMTKVLTKEEEEFVKRGEPASFFRLWTAKEALIKTGRFKFADALKTTFVKNRQILPPNGFSLTQYLFDEYAVSIIEQK